MTFTVGMSCTSGVVRSRQFATPGVSNTIFTGMSSYFSNMNVQAVRGSYIENLEDNNWQYHHTT